MSDADDFGNFKARLLAGARAGLAVSATEAIALEFFIRGALTSLPRERAEALVEGFNTRLHPEGRASEVVSGYPAMQTRSFETTADMAKSEFELAGDAMVAALPGNSWLAAYVASARQTTSAPVAYHVGTGLALLSALVPPQVTMRYGGDLCANQFCLLVGAPGTFKTTAANFARVAAEGARRVTTRRPETREDVHEMCTLRPIPNQLVLAGEFDSAFPTYNAALRVALVEAWDGRACMKPSPDTPAGLAAFPNARPRMNLVATCHPQSRNLRDGLEDGGGGGWASYWMVFAADPPRHVHAEPPEVNASHLLGLQTWATTLADRTARGDMLMQPPPLALDPAAMQLWRAWFESLQSRRSTTGVLSMAAPLARAPQLARKVCIALAYSITDLLVLTKSDGMAPKTNFIPEAVLQGAIAIVEYHLKCVETLLVYGDAFDGR